MNSQSLDQDAIDREVAKFHPVWQQKLLKLHMQICFATYILVTPFRWFLEAINGTDRFRQELSNVRD